MVNHEAVRNHRPELGELAESLLRLGRLSLGLQPSGEIDQDALEEERVARGVPGEHRGTVEDLHDAPGLVEVAVLHLERFAREAAALPRAHDSIVVVGVESAQTDPFVGPFGRREPEELLDLGTRVGMVTVVVGGCHLSSVDDRRQVFDQVPEALLRGPKLPFDAAALTDLERHQLVRFFQLRGPREHAELEVVVRGSESLLRLLLRGDIDHHALPRERPAVQIAQQDRLVADPDHPSVGGDQPVLPRPGLTGRAVQVVGGELDLAIIGV